MSSSALLRACFALDQTGLDNALRQGDDPNQQDEDGRAATIVCLLAASGGDTDTMTRCAAILRALFAAGAVANDRGREDEFSELKTGLEIALERFALPGADPRRDMVAARAVIETWLIAGANPDPQTNHPHPHGMIEHLVRLLNHNANLFNERWESRRRANIEATHEAIVLLASHGCPLSSERLEKAGFTDSDRQYLLARTEQRCLDMRTAGIGGERGRAVKRL